MEFHSSATSAPPTSPTADSPAGAAAPAAGRPDADYNRKTLTRHRNPPAFQPPVQLALTAPPAPLTYDLTARWEQCRGDQVTRTIVRKQLTLTAVPQGPQWLLTIESTPPTLHGPDRTPLEEVVLLLAAVYQKLVLRLSPAGQVLALHNHAEIAQTWAETSQTLIERYGPDEPITAALRTALDAELREPARILASLQFDYTYALLLKNIYQQRFEYDGRYGQAVAFPQFFTDTPVCFQEEMTLGPPPAPGRTALLFTGKADEQRTDRPAVAQQIATLLHPAETEAPPPPPPDPAGLTFAYRAAYDLDTASGWPEAIEATITCGCPAAGFTKEYDLTIERS